MTNYNAHNSSPESPSSNPKQPIFNLPPLIQNTAIFLIAVHFVLPFLPEELYNTILFKLIFIPARFLTVEQMQIDIVATILSPVGHTFIHNDWIHLLSNVGMFIAFAPNLLKLSNTTVVILLWVIGACSGAFVMTITVENPNTFMIGASGAISALLGGLLFLSWQFARLGYAANMPFATKQRIITFFGIWLAINLLMAFFPTNPNIPSIAWEAHIAGLVSGVLVTAVYFQHRIRSYK